MIFCHFRKNHKAAYHVGGEELRWGRLGFLRPESQASCQWPLHMDPFVFQPFEGGCPETPGVVFYQPWTLSVLAHLSCARQAQLVPSVSWVAFTGLLLRGQTRRTPQVSGSCAHWSRRGGRRISAHPPRHTGTSRLPALESGVRSVQLQRWAPEARRLPLLSL